MDMFSMILLNDAPALDNLPTIDESKPNQTLCETKEQELPWSKLPLELVDIILGFAGLHIKFLCGRLRSVDKLDEKTTQAIWHDAFKSGWLGDYSLLPPATGPNKKFTLDNNDLFLVKSIKLYEHLANFFPDASESNPAYESMDMVYHKVLSSDVELSVRGQPLLDTEKYELRLLNIPMRNMWLEILETKITQYPYAVARECIFRGHIDLLRHLLITNSVKIKYLKRYHFKRSFEYYYTMLDITARYGYLDMLKLLLEFGGTDITELAMNWAAMNGHLHVVIWLHENRDEGCTKKAMDWASENGHLDTVIWLHENRDEGCTTDAMDSAAKFGRLDVVKWLHENRSEGCTTDAMDGAATLGNLHVVKWLHENRTEGCTTDAMDEAATHNRLHVVQWFHENRTEGCTTDALNWSAHFGHTDVVKFLLKNRTEGFTRSAYGPYYQNNALLDSHQHLMMRK